LNDFVLSFRQTAPALARYRRNARGSDRYAIEKDYLAVEAGGAVYDINGDGRGHFRKTLLLRGIGFHEARLADRNGDDLLNVLDSPYNWETARMDVWLRRRGPRPGATRGRP